MRTESSGLEHAIAGAWLYAWRARMAVAVMRGIVVIVLGAALPSVAQSRALQFAGGDDRVNVALPLVFDDLATNSFSITTRIRPDVSAPNSRVFFAQKDADNLVSILLNDTNRVYFYVKVNGSVVSLATDHGIPPGAWSHVTATWSAATSQVTLIVNGVAAVASGGTSSSGADNLLTLGARTDGLQPINATLDDFTLWPTVLTEAQIISVALGCPVGITALLQYDFEVGTPGGNNAGLTTLPDISGNGYNGTLSGFALAGPTSNWIDSPHVDSCLGLTPSTLGNGVVGQEYGPVTLSASDGTPPYTYAVTVGALPAGLILSSDGTLSGTPTAGGTFNFTVTATDSSAGTGPYTGSQTYTLVIAAPTITLDPFTLPGGMFGVGYSQILIASGGTAPYTFAVTTGALPAGLDLASDGALTGTPTAGGTFNFTITATDSSAGTGPYTGSQAYTLAIAAPTITLDPPALPGGMFGVGYSQTLIASGGTAPYTFAVTAGALPAGLDLASDGALTGTPTAGGTFNFTITATDSSAGTGPYTGSQAYTLIIAAPTIIIDQTVLPEGTVGIGYSQALTASGGTAPHTFAVTAGVLPAGLDLASNGSLTGTPTAGGTFNFTVTATDSSGGTGPYAGSQAYTLVTAAPTIIIDQTMLPEGTVGVGYSEALTASGGIAPYTFAVTAGALPAGLSLSSDGSLSGTPTTHGSMGFTVTVTDSSTGTGPFTTSQAFVLLIAGGQISGAVMVPVVSAWMLWLLAALLAMIGFVFAHRR